MGGPPIRRSLQGLYRDLERPVRGWLRGIKTELSALRHQLRHGTDADVRPRVVSTLDRGAVPRVATPAISLVDWSVSLSDGQTESSTAPPDGAGGTFFAHPDGLDRLPAVHLEAMVMAAAAEDLDWVAAGWAEPAPGPHGPSGRIGRDSDVPGAAHLLLRRPDPHRRPTGSVVGRVLPHLTSADRCADLEPIDDHPAAGPYRLRLDSAEQAVIRHRCRPLDAALADLPEVDGPPTVLFLLPFLAVGGAERLLFDLMDGLRERYRLLVATTDPHLAALGQTVDRARELAPQTYTLGDWLPRPVLGSALRHLIRRWQVSTLVCWNGSVFFYDEAAALKDAFPDLRIVNQHFNHAGGWIEHLSPSLNRAVDTQIAVNTPTARALVDEYGVPKERVATIHHAVGTPPARDPVRRAALRCELGIDGDTVVIGSFIRLHSQKRPLDIIRVARRMADDPVHFLVVGGGPLDDAFDAELARDPVPNLTRLPMHEDASPFYDAIDLCLMTSDFEGLPVFLLDGLARGIPCVATEVGDIPLLLADGGGRTVSQPGDLDGLAAAIRELLPVEHRHEEGAAARHSVARRFTLDRYVQAYESVIFPSA